MEKKGTYGHVIKGMRAHSKVVDFVTYHIGKEKFKYDGDQKVSN